MLRLGARGVRGRARLAEPRLPPVPFDFKHVSAATSSMSARNPKTAESRNRRPVRHHTPLVALMGESSDEAEANAEEAQRVRRLICARPRLRVPILLQSSRAPALTAAWLHAQTVSLGKQMGLSLVIPKERGTGGRPASRLTPPHGLLRAVRRPGVLAQAAWRRTPLSRRMLLLRAVTQASS